MPSLAKADHTELLAHLFLERAQCLAKTRVLLVYTPQVEWVIKLVDLRNFEPSLLDILESPSGREKVIDAHRSLELLSEKVRPKRRYFDDARDQ